MEEGEVKRTNIRAVALGVAVVFLVGLALGYYIWGYRASHRLDYKDMLRQTITYISTLEEKNQELIDRVGRLENEAGSLKKQLGEPADAQKALQDSRIADLEKENQELKAQAAQREDLLKENEQLRLRVQSLVEELNAAGKSGARSGSSSAPGGAGY
ncbi:MAG TPA: hypothetical protein PLW83_01720 [Deltaproteobacteria bacterium]|nr:hypothetical protein [Deltaproteobacteria bacterium]